MSYKQIVPSFFSFCAIGRFSIAVCFIHSCVYTSAPISRFIPLPHAPCPVFTHLFSRFVSYFHLANKHLCITFLDSTYKRFYTVFGFLCDLFHSVCQSLGPPKHMEAKWIGLPSSCGGHASLLCIVAIFLWVLPQCALYQYICRASSPRITS